MSAIKVLQQAKKVTPEAVLASGQVAYYQPATQDQAYRYNKLSAMTKTLILGIIENAPPSPERSNALNALQEAKFWASAAIAREGLEDMPAVPQADGAGL